MSSKWPTRSDTSAAAGSAKGAESSGRVVKDSTGRVWMQESEWCLKAGPWRIAKCLVSGKARYSLTHDTRLTKWCGIRTAAILGVFDTAKAAMEKAK